MLNFPSVSKASSNLLFRYRELIYILSTSLVISAGRPWVAPCIKGSTPNPSSFGASITHTNGSGEKCLGPVINFVDFLISVLNLHIVAFGVPGVFVRSFIATKLLYISKISASGTQCIGASVSQSQLSSISTAAQNTTKSCSGAANDGASPARVSLPTTPCFSNASFCKK